MVFLAGGGSRADIASVGPLRAFAAIVLAIAVLFQTGRSLKRVAVPLVAIAMLGLWMVLQLIPLPPSLWAALPGREEIAALGEVTGLSDTWRPITFSVMKTSNSLASLVVPLAGLMLLALLDDRGWRRVPWIFMLAGLASGLLGLAQLLLPEATGLYLYDITNIGSAVGLFSNRNHNAIFLTIALLFCAIRIEKTSRNKFAVGDLGAIVCALVIFVGILVNGSRAGLVALGVVGVIVAVRHFFKWRASSGTGQKIALARLIGAGMVGACSLALVAVFVFAGRSPAVDRLLQEDPADDQRVQVLPVVLDMARDFQPFGVGFGAFEQAFRTVETEALLGPRYLNNAHNDWLQFPIEGGVPAVLMALAAIVLLAVQTVRNARKPSADQAMLSNAWLGILVIGILALASMVDYPLRTPSIMLLAVTAAAMFFKPLVDGSRQ